MIAEETHVRSIVKALTYRALAFIGIYVFAVWFGLSQIYAISLALFDFSFKLAVYYANERLWAHVKWGYHAPKYDILEEIEEVIEK